MKRECWSIRPYWYRASSIARYLSWASPPWQWAVSRATCPLCGRALLVALEPSPFMTRCLSCRGTVITLSLIPVINYHFRDAQKSGTAYELSTYGATLAHLRRTFSEVVTSEYHPDKPLGVECAGTLNQDVQRLTFPDCVFDLVTSNQVFEHVPDDCHGFRECWRVLKPGGALVFSVPMHDIPATEQWARVINDEIVWLGEPEYHDSRLAGAKSAPTFWHHSLHDIAARVKSAGFAHAEVASVTLTQIQGSPALVVYATK